MIAALLPLPSSPILNMRERDISTSNLDGSNDPSNDYIRQFGPMDEARYESAKWWRRLNRWMSLVGFLIIAAIVRNPYIIVEQTLTRYRLSLLLLAFDRAGSNLPPGPTQATRFTLRPASRLIYNINLSIVLEDLATSYDFRICLCIMINYTYLHLLSKVIF
jgi:hypothetical protein